MPDWFFANRSLPGRFLAKAALCLPSAFLALTCLAAEKNLYLIASEPNANQFLRGFPTVLYRLEGERLTRVRTITTKKQDTLFVRPFHDKGLVCVGSIGAYEGAFLLDVLHLDAMAEERAFDLDGCWGCYYSTSHLLNRDGRLIYLIRSPSHREERDCACRDLAVDLRTGEAINELDAGDLKDAYAYGAPGGMVSGGDFGAPIYADDRQAVLRSKNGLETHDLGWELPPGLKLGRYSMFQEFSTRLAVNNDHMRVLTEPVINQRADGLSAARTFHVFDKASEQWSALELPGSGSPMEAF